ncbi:hypothetical protein [Halopseudomonas sp.]|uniref:hypothetical protein n=1 Tax=Halopseudomonas sp. TaxID=2901191 RepID=UPI00300186CB
MKPFDDDQSESDPLTAGAAVLPAMQGEGCLLRFSPEALNEQMGADFSAAATCPQFSEDD